MIHLTDMEIQEYVLERAACSPHVIAHVQICSACREATDAYEVLFAGIKAQEVETFDFAVSDLVLGKISSSDYKIPVVLTGSLFAGAAFYFFRNDIANLFTGIPPLLFYFIIVSAGTVVLFLLADMYKEYQKKMTLLEKLINSTR